MEDENIKDILDEEKSKTDSVLDQEDEATELGEHQKIKGDQDSEEKRQWKDQLLRLAADFENFKKRSAKDMEDARNYAVTNFAKDLLSVMDNFQRSIDALKNEDEDNQRIKSVKDGILSIQKELENSLSRQNIQAISPEIGEDFDHNFHQAIMQSESEEVEEGKISSLLQVGYKIKERLLRPALVAIAKRKSEN